MCIRDKLIKGKSLSKFYQNRSNKSEKAEGSEMLSIAIIVHVTSACVTLNYLDR